MEKILYKNKTALNKEIYKNFLVFHQSKNNWKFWIYTITFFILFIIILAFQIKATNKLSFFLIFSIFLVFLYQQFIFPTKKIQKEFKSEKIQKELLNTFTFYSKYFTVQNNLGKTQIKYYKIYKFYSTSNYFYIHLDKNNAFLLSKSNFTVGTPNDFEKFIKSKLRILHI